MTQPQGHSILGASGAYRWLPAPWGGGCTASVSLSQGLHDEESDFAAQGTAAHSLGEYCLHSQSQPWEIMGTKIDGDTFYPAGMAGGNEDKPGFVVDKEMADAVQVYLDAVQEWHPDRNQGNSFVEKRFHCPTIHPLFYGTSDLVYIDHDHRTLHIWDYKHGAGIVVEAENNPQLMYYACGAIEELALWERIDNVVMHIAQPRGFHFDGPIRQSTIDTNTLVTWLEDVLIPAMDKALIEGSRETASGDHCRFCPARAYACPQIMQDIDELEKLNNMPAEQLTIDQLARRMKLFNVFKIAHKADEETTFKLLTSGKEVPGWKLAPKRANREWKEGAEKEIKKKFGAKALTVPELKSPAQIDAMPEGKAQTARWAFKPETGLTVVPMDDARPAVNTSTKSLFEAKPKKGK